MRLHLDVFGDAQLDRELLRYQDRFSDLSPAFEVLADDFLDVNRRQFASEGGNSGHWAPLAASTVRSRQGARGGYTSLTGAGGEIRTGVRTLASSGYGVRILDDTGDLRRSLTSRDGAKGAIRQISEHEMFVGTDIDYAHFHQSGTRNMPRRRPVELTRGDRERWVKSLQRFVSTGEPGIGL